MVSRTNKKEMADAIDRLKKINRALFSYGICPVCAQKPYGDQNWFDALERWQA